MNCLECGEKVTGRSDKKFCDDGCRNSYNNRMGKDFNNLMRSTHNKLRKNYRILFSLNFIDGKSKVRKALLMAEGFDFEFFTSYKVYKNGAEYRFVYDTGYRFLDDDYILVVKKN